MRIINLILTAIFGLWGYIAAIILLLAAIATNRTVSGKSYIYPLIPFNLKQLSKRLFRYRLAWCGFGAGGYGGVKSWTLRPYRRNPGVSQD